MSIDPTDIINVKSKIAAAAGAAGRASELLGNSLTRNGSLADAGRAAMNALYPRDFAYYLIAFEVVDSQGDTFVYMSFPVMPSNVVENAQRVVSVKKTMGGVVSTDTDTFIPVDISMSGNFGKRLKIILGKDFESWKYAVANISLGRSASVPLFSSFRSMPQKSYQSFRQAMKNNYQNFKDAVLDQKIKTGYGAVKLLESITKMDGALDQYGLPYRIYLYNPALGNNYMVKVINFQHKMSVDMNTIHQYSLQLKGVAPLDYIIGEEANRSANLNNLSVKFVQNSANKVFNIVKKRLIE